MKDQIVSFEVAKLAKENGFDEQCDHVFDEEKEVERLWYYKGDGSGFIRNSERDCITNKNLLTAPTQSLLQKWLRDIHGIFITIEQDFEPIPNAKPINGRGDTLMQHSGKYFLIVRPKGEESPPNSTICNTYEEALEAALLKELNLIKDEN